MEKGENWAFFRLGQAFFQLRILNKLVQMCFTETLTGGLPNFSLETDFRRAIAKPSSKLFGKTGVHPHTWANLLTKLLSSAHLQTTFGATPKYRLYSQ